MRILGLAIFAVSLLAAPAAAQPLTELQVREWREDLRFTANEIRTRHANYTHHVDGKTFEQAVADLDRRIPQLERNDIIVGMMRIAAMIGDGHTRIEPRKDKAFGFPSLPVKLYLFDDGLFIRATRPSQRHLLGARVEAVGGVPVDQAIRRVADLASQENAMGEKLYIPLFLAMPDILEAVGLSEGRNSARLTVSRAGRRWTVTLPVGEVDPSWPPDTDVSLITPNGWVDSNRGAVPLWLRAPLDYHRLIEMPDRHAIYAQINMITDVDGETLGQLGDKILARANQSNPRTVVLDLRLAQGGNGDLRTDLIRNLVRAEDDDTQLYLLTARGTFSASQFILDDVDRLTHATIVGEPASSSPTGYGDGYRSQMPNSKIAVRTSIAHWQSGQNFAPWTYVDLAVPYRFSDYAAGRDPVLEAALSGRRPADLTKSLLALPASAPEAAVSKVVATVLDDASRIYSDKEQALIDAALALSSAERPQAALVVGREGAARFPASTWTAYVYGAMAEDVGDKVLAEQQARRAMALDRNNRSARSLLEKVTGKPQ